MYLFTNTFVLGSQEKGLLFSQYYSPEQYNAAFQNWVIAQDNRGVFYFGNSGGLLEYDGNEFRRINVPNNSAVRTISIDSSNQIFIGAYEELGVLLPDNKGILTYHSLTPLIDSSYQNFGDIWESHCIDDDIYFLTDNYLFRYKDKHFDYWEATHERFYLSFVINQEFYVQEIGKGLMKLNNDSLVLIENGDFFKNKRIHAILELDNKLLVCTRTQGFFLYDLNKATITPFSQLSENAQHLNNYFIQNTFYHGIKLNENLFALSSIEGAVLIVDLHWNVVDVIDEESTGVKSNAQYLYYEKDRALWMAMSNGICRVDILSAFRFWNDNMGINGAISDVATLDDYFYISTLSGVYSMHKKGGLADFSTNHFNEVEGKFEQAWGFLYFIKPGAGFENTYTQIYSGDKNFHPTSNQIKLLVSSSTGIHEISENQSLQISKYRGIFDIYQFKKDPTKLFLSLSNGIALLSYKNGRWIDLGMPFGITDKIREISEDSEGNLWASAIYKGIYKIENPLSNDYNVTFFDTNAGLPSVKTVQFFRHQDKLLFLSNQGIYEYKESTDSFASYSFPEDTRDSTNQFIDSLSWYTFYNTQLSELYVSTYADSVEWFGTSNGIFRHSPKKIKNYGDLKPPLIRKVLSGDSIIFGGTNYRKAENTHDSLLKNQISTDPVISLGNILEFKDNSLTFHYTLPFYENEVKNEYSFFLEGNDETWSPWTTETKKEYTNLREGDYTFKVKAKNLYQIESPVTEFKFTVLAPWYRTFAAVLGYIILGIILIIVIVRLYTYRLIKEKEKLEKIVIERTQEILMQKEEILVQAEHLKDANERISAKNEELEKQKEEIEKHRDELAISNATKNKFFRIIAHDLRNPISTLAGSTNLIFNDFDEYNKEQTKNFIGELNKLSQTTFNLLENLLDWSSSQMGEIKYEPQLINLNSLTRENIELIKRKVDSKNITLINSITDNYEAFADENMVKTIIRNLLSNAVKFTPNNGEIVLNCFFDNQFVKYSVKDSGIGIAKKDQKKLFRIDAHHTTPGLSNEKGSGLGLILCKEFVERNGGKIHITSEPTKGTTIEFTLKKHLS